MGSDTGQPASPVSCVCGHGLHDHFEGCCFVQGCFESTGLAPCYL